MLVCVALHDKTSLISSDTLVSFFLVLARVELREVEFLDKDAASASARFKSLPDRVSRTNVSGSAATRKG